jgi:putative molybdopterin biosynthesis protein
VAVKTEYLTTKELAELLRIKERKVYDLAASGKVPCSRATGKLLFSRAQINDWLANNSSGLTPTLQKQRPNIFLGSHDPLMEWALMQSRSGLASFFDSSFDGLDRYENHEGIATGLHIYDAETEQWNVPVIAERFANEPIVLMEWAWRHRGLIVAPGTGDEYKDITSLIGKRFVPRQAEAGSQQLFEHLLKAANMAPDQLEFISPARGETYAAQAVIEGKADAAFGLEALAKQYRLDFIPVIKERFDLMVDRHFWFEQPMQTFLSFCNSQAFRNRADELGGYDISNLSRVLFNGR